MRRSSCSWSLALLSAALLICACSDSSAEDTDSAGDTAGDTAGDGDGDDTSSNGDGDGDGEACAEPDPAVSFTVGFGGFVALNDPAPNVNWTCTINQLDVSGGLSVELDCPDAPDPIVITISATPAFSASLTGDETLQLRYLSFMSGEANTYLRLDVEGSGHLLTLVDGDSLAPPAEHGFEHFVPITEGTGLCTPTSYFCGSRERVAASFDLGDAEPYEVLDGSHGLIGAPPGIDVWVEEAYVNHTECDDEPVGKARMLVVNQG